MIPPVEVLRPRRCQRAALAERRARPSAWSARRLALVSAFAGLAALGSAAAFAPVARADEPAAPAAAAARRSPEEIERTAESIARSIMSPFCPGRTVSACPVAGPWRDDIRRWVAEDVDPLEIKRRLAERVPEHNLAGVPKNRLGWVLPVGLGIAAIALLVFLLRKLISPRSAGATASGGSAKAKANSTPPPAKASSEDYDARLDEELETLER